MSTELDESDGSRAIGPDVSKTTRELFADTLEGEYDDDRPWAAVRALHMRNDPEIFEVASEFCQSTDPLRRARGLDVLGQLDTAKLLSERPHFDDCVRIAIQHLAEEDPLVVHSAAWALAHLPDDDRAISALIAVRTGADWSVRHAVAYGLANEGRPEAIQTLMELMEDANDEVRDWATFGLGAWSAQDSPQIREALHNRLTDTFVNAREEAMWGLALRKDPIGLRMLLDRFVSDVWVKGDLDAAVEILELPSDDLPVADLCSGLKQILESQFPTPSVLS